MKNQIKYTSIALASLALSTINHQLSTARAQGTAFTYQGRLNNSSGPASGSYDFKFTMFNTNVTGVAYAGPITNSAVAVSNGLFIATVDFGAGVFTGGSNWLEVAVRTNGSGGFGTLTPRQQLSPTPYAITAEGLNGLSIQQNISGAPNVIGGAQYNFVASGVAGATVAGGGAANYLGGGTVYSNSVTGDFGTVGGGRINSAAYDATVGGGVQNTASGSGATVGGGEFNTASSQDTTVSGGGFNTASALWATVAGGYNNTASGQFSFAAGRLANAAHSGSFVWSDDSGTAFSSTTSGQFSVRARGGIVLAGDIAMVGGNVSYHNFSLSGGNSTGYLYGSYPALGDGVHLGYNYYYDFIGNGHPINPGGATSRLTVGYGFVGIYVGGVNAAPTTQRLVADSTGVTVNGTFNNSSDRNAKQDFAPVNVSQILEKVLQLPVSEWSYKEDAQTRHIGPMGQDFHSLFKIGTDEKHLAPIDEGGVALAAIQGLNQKVAEKDAEIQSLKHQNDSLAERLNELEVLVKSIAAKQ